MLSCQGCNWPEGPQTASRGEADHRGQPGWEVAAATAGVTRQEFSQHVARGLGRESADGGLVLTLGFILDFLAPVVT